MRRVTVALVAFVLCGSHGGARQQTWPLRPALERMLSVDLGFLPGELDAVRAGGIAARVLTTPEIKEVAVAAAMHTSVSADYFVTRIGNVGVPTNASTPETGRFRKPAVAADLSAWKLAPADLRSIDLCDVRACGIHLDDALLTRLRFDAGPKALTAANAWSDGVREAIAGYVAAYQSGGAGRLPIFRNGAAAIITSAALDDVRSRLRFLDEPFPALMRFVDRYPDEPPPDGVSAQQFVWSIDIVMATPVLSAMHWMVWRSPGPVADAVLLGQQIYTSREVDALMTVTLISSDDGPAKPGATVVEVTRSVSSSLQGLVGGAARQTARAQARTSLEGYLKTIRTAFERDAGR